MVERERLLVPFTSAPAVVAGIVNDNTVRSITHGAERARPFMSDPIVYVWCREFSVDTTLCGRQGADGRSGESHSFGPVAAAVFGPLLLGFAPRCQPVVTSDGWPRAVRTCARLRRLGASCRAERRVAIAWQERWVALRRSRRYAGVMACGMIIGDVSRPRACAGSHEGQIFAGRPPPWSIARRGAAAPPKLSSPRATRSLLGRRFEPDHVSRLRGGIVPSPWADSAPSRCRPGSHLWTN